MALLIPDCELQEFRFQDDRLVQFAPIHSHEHDAGPIVPERGVRLKYQTKAIEQKTIEFAMVCDKKRSRCPDIRYCGFHFVLKANNASSEGQRIGRYGFVFSRAKPGNKVLVCSARLMEVHLFSPVNTGVQMESVFVEFVKWDRIIVRNHLVGRSPKHFFVSSSSSQARF